MTKIRKRNAVKITVGEAIGADASKRFVDAWHRAEVGETFQERHLAFESQGALVRVLMGRCGRDQDSDLG